MSIIGLIFIAIWFILGADIIFGMATPPILAIFTIMSCIIGLVAIVGIIFIDAFFKDMLDTTKKYSLAQYLSKLEDSVKYRKERKKEFAEYIQLVKENKITKEEMIKKFNLNKEEG